jgi:hypothetical protein
VAIGRYEAKGSHFMCIQFKISCAQSSNLEPYEVILCSMLVSLHP